MLRSKLPAISCSSSPTKIPSLLFVPSNMFFFLLKAISFQYWSCTLLERVQHAGRRGYNRFRVGRRKQKSSDHLLGNSLACVRSMGGWFCGQLLKSRRERLCKYQPVITVTMNGESSVHQDGIARRNPRHRILSVLKSNAPHTHMFNLSSR